MNKGDTFLLKSPPKYDIAHLYVILSGVINNKMLLVNVTTKKNNSDCSCILVNGDHSFISHESVINYADAIEADCDKIEKFFNSGFGESSDPVSTELLKKIIDGALISPSFPPKFKKYLI